MSRVKSLIVRSYICGLLEKYDESFNQQLEQNIIKRVPLCNNTEHVKVHYIPHTAVISQTSTIHLRNLFDASASNPSMKDFLQRSGVITRYLAYTKLVSFQP